MAVFYFKCPFCEREIKAYSEWENQTGSCPYCNYDVIIRNPGTEIENFNQSRPAPPAPEPAKKSRYSLPEGVPILSGKSVSHKKKVTKKQYDEDREDDLEERIELLEERERRLEHMYTWFIISNLFKK